MYISVFKQYSPPLTVVTGRLSRAVCKRRKNASCSASKSGTSFAGAGLKLHVFFLG
jgi:hypothetical protein